MGSSSSKPIQRLSLFHNLSWTTLGNITYTVSQWAILAFLAKAGTPRDVGLFALALSIATPVMVAANFELRTLYITDAASSTRSFHLLMSLRWLLSGVGVLISLLLAFLYRGGGEVILFTLFLAVAKALDNVADMLFALFQQAERMDKIAKAQILNGLLSVSLFTSAFWVTSNLASAMAAYAAASFFALFLYLYPISRRGFPVQLASTGVKSWNLLRMNIARGDVRSILSRASPLTAAAVVVSLSMQIPRYLVSFFEGESTLGIFAALSYVTVAGSTIVSAVGRSSLPRLTVLSNLENGQGFIHLIVKLEIIVVALGLSGFVLAFIAGETILSLIYSPEYAMYSGLLLGLIVSATSAYVGTILDTGALALGKYGDRLRSILLRVAVLFFVGMVITPHWGMGGVVAAMVSSTLAQNLMLLRVLKSSFPYLAHSKSRM